jgi:hypothetical protein
MRAYATLSIHIDAYSPDLNDGTVDASHAVLERLKAKGEVYDVVEHTAEQLVVSMRLDGDFMEIKP